MAVRPAASTTRAMPKSISFACGSPSQTSTFCGLMSRWTTPREWAWSSASQRSAPTSATSRSESSPSRLSAPQGLALDQLGDQVGAAVLLAELVEGDDAGVVEAGGGLRLAHDPLPGLLARLDHLDRDVALEAGVPGPVDGAEAAAAELALDLEPVEDQCSDQCAIQLRRSGGRSCPAASREKRKVCCWSLRADPSGGHTPRQHPLGGTRLDFLDEDPAPPTATHDAPRRAAASGPRGVPSASRSWRGGRSRSAADCCS